MIPEVDKEFILPNCTLIVAIGEGVNRINRLMPDFLNSNFSSILWIDIVGMRNRLAHGYFELDAEIILNTIKTDMPSLRKVIIKAISLCERR